MPELMIFLVIVFLIMVISMNRKDRIDVEDLVIEIRAKERMKNLMELENKYKKALRNSDRISAENLGNKYYKEKTEYEYWEAALEPRWDMGGLSDGEKNKINKFINNNNLAIMQTIVSRNERALASDLEALDN